MKSDNVKYTGDLNAPFVPDMMDEFQVRNFLTGELEKCEHWGWNDEGEGDLPYFDFGSLGSLGAFEISAKAVNLFTPWALYVAFDIRNPLKLSFVGENLCPPAGHGMVSDRLGIDIVCPKPKTAKDMLLYLNDFYNSWASEFAALQHRHTIKRAVMAQRRRATVREDEDLPF